MKGEDLLIIFIRKPKFALGGVLATPGALALLAEHNVDPQELLKRHVTGDWGDLDDEDKRLNDQAIRFGNRILSAYYVAEGEKVWIITERDRSATTLLLPSEY